MKFHKTNENMKKQLLLIAHLFFVITVFSQNIKATQGNRLIELKMNGLLSSPELDLNKQYGGLMIRDFITNNNVRRISADFKFSMGDAFTVSDLTLNYGNEKHMKGTDKMSPYWGWDGGIKLKNFADGKLDNLSLNCGLFTGFDYYITDGIYLGAEIGYSLNLEMNPFSIGSNGAATRSGLKFGYILN